MTREEFLERFSLLESVPFEGRGPHRASDRDANAREMLIHLFSATDARESELAARVSDLSGGAFRVYDLGDTIAIVTPNELSYISLESWLDSLPATRSHHRDPSQSAPTKPFSIKVRARSGTTGSSTPRVTAAQSTPAPAPPSPTPAAPAAAAPPAFTPPNIPADAIPPGEKLPGEKSPGEFTLAFGSPRKSQPAAPPPPPVAAASPPIVAPPPEYPVPRPPATPAPPQSAPGAGAPRESMSSFTQLFGESGTPPTPQTSRGPLNAPDLAAPKFVVNQPPPERPPKPPVSPPPPTSDPGEFTRFFGVPSSAHGADALRSVPPLPPLPPVPPVPSVPSVPMPPRADAVRQPSPPPFSLPQPDLGAFAPRLPKPGPTAAGDKSASASHTGNLPEFSPEASLFSRVTKTPGSGLDASAVEAASRAGAGAAEQSEKPRPIIPMVLVLSVAAIAVLVLILVVILTRR